MLGERLWFVRSRCIGCGRFAARLRCVTVWVTLRPCVVRLRAGAILREVVLCSACGDRVLVVVEPPRLL